MANEHSNQQKNRLHSTGKSEAVKNTPLQDTSVKGAPQGASNPASKSGRPNGQSMSQPQKTLSKKPKLTSSSSTTSSSSFGAKVSQSSGGNTAHGHDASSPHSKTTQNVASSGSKLSGTKAASSRDGKTQRLHGQQIQSSASQKQAQTSQKQSAQQSALQSQKNGSVKSEGSRPVARRRPAGPARARIAANDDRPSIGGLIFALQQKPSQKPYTIAMISSGIWVFLGLLLSWAVVGEEISRQETLLQALASPQTIIVAAVIVIPISLFWFLALLVVRAQELRLMSSAMTEVAVRLAEPDRMAEQQVASLGQTVRRQVAAMNDAISRSLGRAGELEALVHNEVAMLERSYSENEMRIRGLLQELASEREALTNNSERVSDAINNIGLRVAQDVSHAGERVTKALGAATNSLADSLASKGEKVTAAINAAGTAVDQQLAERGNHITKQIVTQGIQATERIEQAGAKVNNALQESTDRTTALVTSRGNSLLKALSSMNERIRNELPALLESLGGEQIRLSKIIEGAVKNLAELELSIVKRSAALENTLGDRTQHLQDVLARHLEGIDKAVIERAKTLDASMLERTKMLDAAFSKRVDQINSALDNQTNYIQKSMQDRTKAIEVAMADQSSKFDQSFMRSVDGFRRTTEKLTSESVRTIEALSGQSEMLKQVSEGLLSQVHGLIGRFESRGHSFMQAAHSLENSQFKIDSVLENRQSELNSLLDTISVKADQLDTMMKSYSTKLEGSLNEAQSRARELTHAISTGSEANSQTLLEELERLRNDTQKQTESAVAEMRKRFSSITSEVSSHIHTLSDSFTDVTDQLKNQTHEVSKNIDETHNELREKVDNLPNIARESSSAMSNALKDQLHAIHSLSEIAAGHGRSRDVSPEHSQKINGPGTNGKGQTFGNGKALPNPAPTQQSAPLPPPQRVMNTPSTPSLPPPHMHADMPKGKTKRGAQQPPVAPPPQHFVQDTMAGSYLMADDNGKWSLGDLLQRASQPDDVTIRPVPNAAAQHQNFAPQPQHGSTNGGSPAYSDPQSVAAQKKNTAVSKAQPLDMQLIAQAIDQRVAAELWQRYQSGERGIFSRSLYTPNGQLTFDEILQRYNTDPEFMHTVDRYLNDFERLLREADQKDPRGQLVQNYLTSETGRVYLLLAHASGRLG